MMKPLKPCLLCLVVSAGVTVSAAITETAVDMTASGDWEITVGTDETNEVTAVQSGTGRIIKKGRGLLVLKQANTFSGGLVVSNGTVRVDAAGGLGSGAVELASTSFRQLIFNASGATFANDIVLSDFYSVSWSAGHIKFTAPTELSGSITSPKGDLMFEILSGANLTLSGAVNTGEHEFQLDQTADVTLSGAVTCSVLRVSRTGWGRTGNVYFPRSDYSIRQIWIRSGTVVPRVEDAFSGAELYLYHWWGESNRARINLEGLDQKVSALGSRSEEDGGLAFGSFPNGGTVNSSAAATLTITGSVSYAGAPSAVSRFRINDTVSVTLDAPGFTQVFSEREHRTKGDITVRNGTFRAVDSVNFQYVPEISVEEGGVLEIAVTNGVVFSGCTTCLVDGKLTVEAGTVFPFTQDAVELSVGADAEITLPEGAVLYCKSLTVDGQVMAPGTYSSGNMQQIRQGALVLRGGGSVAWTGGGGADTGIGTAANWGGTVPDILFGSADLTFAQNGSEALIGSDVAFGSLTLSAADGFTFRSGAEDVTVNMVGDVTTSKAEADEADERTYSFEMPVVFGNTGVTVLHVATNDTVTYSSGLVQSGADGGIEKTGPGRMTLCDGTVLNRQLDIQEGTVVFQGLIATPGHVDQGVPNLSQERILLKNGSSPKLVLDGAIVEKPLYGLGTGSGVIFATASNTVNTFKGNVMLNAGGAMDILANGPDAKIVFEGGFVSQWSAICGGGGTVEFKDHSVRTNSWRGLTVGTGTKVVFSGTKNLVTEMMVFQHKNGVMDFRESYAFTSPVLLYHFGHLYGTVLEPNTVCLNSTTQQVVHLYCKTGKRNPSVITGDEGALLEVMGGSTNTMDWTGAVSLLKSGEDVMWMWKTACSSTGNVTVTGGTLEFGDGGGWPNGKSVSVGGTGVLKVSEPGTFNDGIELSLCGDGVISVADGVTVKADVMYVDGRRMPSGRYTYATAPESVKAHLDPLATGAILVNRKGLALTIR